MKNQSTFALSFEKKTVAKFENADSTVSKQHLTSKWCNFLFSGI